MYEKPLLACVSSYVQHFSPSDFRTPVLLTLNFKWSTLENHCILRLERHLEAWDGISHVGMAQLLPELPFTGRNPLGPTSIAQGRAPAINFSLQCEFSVLRSRLISSSFVFLRTSLQEPLLLFTILPPNSQLLLYSKTTSPTQDRPLTWHLTRS